MIRIFIEGSVHLYVIEGTKVCMVTPPPVNSPLTVAQLVEHRAVTREVVSSTPAEPTLRVLK